MKDKLKKAILNNNDLYEAVFGARQIKSFRTDSVWYSLEKTPPLYSNLVTTGEDWKPDDIFSAIDSNYEKKGWDEWSIKDSFNTLDLREYGFQKLFDAQWIYLEAAKFVSTEPSKNLRYEITRSEDDLVRWRMAWDADEQLGKEIFHPKLLAHPKVYFIAGYEHEQIISGCLVNKTGDVLGISNFFAPAGEINCWSDMLGFIFSSIERADVVGYERNDLVEKLQTLGFEAVGDLAVWLKKRV
jgi:hypothetical protein